MRVLVVGSGGREHALVWKISQSKLVSKIYCAPGNAGISELAETVPIKQNEIEKLLRFALDNKIELTVVGPEEPLAMGIVDVFEREGLKIFGPARLPAEIESSKAFAKNFMKKYGIPTANYEVFSSDKIREAKEYVKSLKPPVVLKADGLAGGKGTIICQSVEEAVETIELYFVKKIFGRAGEKIVVEDYLEGDEASVFAITDGENFLTLYPAQDHKRALDNDRGKNTGGMGAYAPTPLVDEKLMKRIEDEIIKPAINGLKAEGRTYKGCLYCGLMITGDGPKVLEFNCRFGDPETQVVLPLLESDLVEIMLASIEGGIDKTSVELKKGTAVCVVLASGGYPDKYETGKEIYGLDKVSSMSDIFVFHAGTKLSNGKVLTSGGRVLGVTAVGEYMDFEGTIKKAYEAVKMIKFDKMHYRKDIARKVFRYLQNKN